MKVKKLLKHIDFLEHITIIQTDAYVDKNHEPDEIFTGNVMDVPWYIGDYYLDTNDENESISTQEGGTPIKGKNSSLIIFVRSSKDDI